MAIQNPNSRFALMTAEQLLNVIRDTHLIADIEKSLNHTRADRMANDGIQPGDFYGTYEVWNDTLQYDIAGTIGVKALTIYAFDLVARANGPVITHHRRLRKLINNHFNDFC